MEIPSGRQIRNPFYTVEALQQDQHGLHELFNSVLAFWPMGEDALSKETRGSLIEVSEDEKNIQIAIGLRGLAFEDIDVSVRSDILTIRKKNKRKNQPKRRDKFGLMRFLNQLSRLVFNTISRTRIQYINLFRS
jgi:HSP20 family molecular chaperone IbpA